MRLHFDTIDSTSTYIKQHIDEFKHGDWASASFQTGGRGQRGNSWEGECGKNTLFSIMLRPYAVRPDQGFFLNYVLSLGILDALDAFMPERPAKVKWPNDIYVGDKKLSGNLIECTMSSKCIETAVLGIGINVNQMHFVSDAPNPVSMAQVAGHMFDVDQFTLAVVDHVLKRYDILAAGHDLHDEYMSRLYRHNEWHDFLDSAGNRFNGMIFDVRPDGLLVVKTRDDNFRCFEFKSIKYII